MELLSGGVAVRRVEFVSAKRKDVGEAGRQRLKGFVLLNEKQDETARSVKAPLLRPAKKAPPPAADALDCRWHTITHTGAGLSNLGNTCFMNATLQCLMHTPPLAEAMVSDRPLGLAPVNGFDPVTPMRQLFRKALLSRAGVLSPVAHTKMLRRISKSFRPGRQEDAHEYLTGLLDALHESLTGVARGTPPGPPPHRQSLITQIFGGELVGSVRCTSCGHASLTRQAMTGLHLDISRASSVAKALHRMAAPDVLEGQNAYRCSEEKRLVRAEKRLLISRPPLVLALQLKRFEFSSFGRKVARHVDYEPVLDISVALAPPEASPTAEGGCVEVPAAAAPRSRCLYDLFAVLVHAGHGVHSGHYYAYFKAPNGLWYLADDESVRQVPESTALSQKAYILFYGGRKGAAAPRATAAAADAPAPEDLRDGPRAVSDAFEPRAEDPTAPHGPARAEARPEAPAPPPAASPRSPTMGVAAPFSALLANGESRSSSDDSSDEDFRSADEASSDADGGEASDEDGSSDGSEASDDDGSSDGSEASDEYDDKSTGDAQLDPFQKLASTLARASRLPATPSGMHALSKHSRRLATHARLARDLQARALMKQRDALLQRFGALAERTARARADREERDRGAPLADEPSGDDETLPEVRGGSMPDGELPPRGLTNGHRHGSGPLADPDSPRASSSSSSDSDDDTTSDGAVAAPAPARPAPSAPALAPPRARQAVAALRQAEALASAPWDGTDEALRAELARARRQEDKAAASRRPDAYDSEYDRGNLKKVRRSADPVPEHGLRDALDRLSVPGANGRGSGPGGRGRGFGGGDRGRGRGFGGGDRGRGRGFGGGDRGHGRGRGFGGGGRGFDGGRGRGRGGGRGSGGGRGRGRFSGGRGGGFRGRD